MSATDAFARAGGGEGYSGGSSGSSFGGSSYSSSGGGDFLFDLVFLYIRFVILYPVFGVPLTLFFLYLGWQYGLFLNHRREERAIGSGLQKQNETRLREEGSQLRARDPNFDTPAFLRRATDAFMKIQAAWSAGDMTPARYFVSDGVYERFSRQLEDLKSRGLVNLMEGVTVSGAEIISYESDDHFDALHVWFRASARDRTLDASGTVLKSVDGEFEEVWSFLRRPGAKTLKHGGGIEGQCPNCGAPLKIADAGKCAACGTWVNSGDHDWILAEITQRSEWAPTDSHRDIGGWTRLSESDPAANLQALEDRASVMFWRWLDALRLGKPGPLSSVASGAHLPNLVPAGSAAWWRDAAVGSVDVMACERGGGVDRVHVQVKWEAAAMTRTPEGERRGSRSLQRHFFILERDAGVKTDARQGLRTARCPSCGAPPSGRDEAGCAYCGGSLIDLKKDWALTAIVPFGQWRRPDTAHASGPAALPAAPGLEWGAGLAPADAAGILARAMVADGELSPHERRYLLEYGRKRGLSGERVSAIIDAARAGLLDAPKPADGAQAEEMLRGLARMSLADGKVSDGERSALEAFGRRFGLHVNDVKAVVEEERAALVRS